MKLIVFVGLIFFCAVECKSQSRQPQQWVHVEGIDSKNFLPAGLHVYFAVRSSREKDTVVMRTYDQTLEELRLFLAKFNLDEKLEFVKRADDDFSGRDNFGTFRLAASEKTRAQISAQLRIQGVEIQKVKYYYLVDIPSVRAELTRSAVAAGKLRAAEIAKSMDMKLGKVIYVQDYFSDSFLAIESDNPIQTASVKVYLAMQLLPSR